MVSMLRCSARATALVLSLCLPVVGASGRRCASGVRVGGVGGMAGGGVGAMRGSTSKRRTTIAMNAHWMDVLKHGGKQPTFDVVEKTKELTKMRPVPPEMYADDYVFRGPVIGPIGNAEVTKTQQGFQVVEAFPDLERKCFGYHVDPDNPFKVMFFERWTGTHTGTIQAGFYTLPPTNNKVEVPTHVTSVVWNPEGKVMYQSISAPLDRFEGNTKGVGAVLGLLAGAGLDALTQKGLSPQPGNPLWIAQAKIFRTLGIGGKGWSEEKDIPKWWKSKARGGEDTDL